MGSKKKNKTIIAVLAAIALGVLLFATATVVGSAREEKSKYISASERLALLDFADAVEEMEAAAQVGDLASVNRAAGKAEAYLSRAGLDNCGEVYGIIGGICEGEYGSDVCAMLLEAVKKAVDGDGGAALRALSGKREERKESAEETTEDLFSERVLSRLGQGHGDVAYNRAVSFACPNAVFEECDSEGTNPHRIKYAGENIFISIAGENPRVQMYCFDRDVDSRYSISETEAMKTVKSLIKREKLKLPKTSEMTFVDGIYRTVYMGEGEYSDTALVTIEVYGDTGRLRKYDAVNYYRIGR